MTTDHERHRYRSRRIAVGRHRLDPDELHVAPHSVMMGLDLYEANGVDASTWIVPILGAKRLYRLEENNAAADVQRSAEQLNAIRAAADRIAIVGARYPEHLDRLTNR